MYQASANSSLVPVLPAEGALSRGRGCGRGWPCPQNDSPQDLRGGGGLFAREDATPFDLVVVVGFALAEVGTLYPLDGVGLPVDAAGGEGRVGGGHLEGAHARAQTPDGCRGVRVYRGGHAHGHGEGDSRGAIYNIPTLRTPPPPYAVLRLPRGRVRAAPARPSGRSRRSPRSTRSRTWRRTCPPVPSAGRERSLGRKPGPPRGGRERIGC